MVEDRSWNASSDYDMIVSTVESHFLVKDHYLRERGSIEFRVNPTPDLKQSFTEVAKKLKSRGFITLLRKMDSDIILMVGKVAHVTRFSRKKPLLLFLIVIGVVLIDGWWRSTEFISRFELNFDPVFLMLVYTLAIMGIIGVHELGHMIASATHSVRSSLPYFIPGLPGYLPTFGALITAGEPPFNRDALFDLGLSGPISGLIITLIVTIPGSMTSILLPSPEANQMMDVEGIFMISPSLLMLAFFELTGMVQEGMTIVLSPLGFAAWLGFIITFLNILPAWQLDGGHIVRAVLGRDKHKVATYVSILVLFLLGYWLMALLVLFLSMGRVEMSPLDDVTSVSKGRKYIFIVVIILTILLAPLPF
ncbi:MAG: site-2 protease family protein [Candidatus Methylarchaceae archaeon HK01B]|nr:site-2 protease family protein [Candidatus Methylarchaceae archaeon HK01B]